LGVTVIMRSFHLGICVQDLGSTNILELCASLMTSCSMVSVEIIPVLLPVVIEKLTHSK